MIENKNHKRYFVPGLERGLAVLQIFSEGRSNVSLTDVSRKLELSPSSAFRLVYTLEHLGFLCKIENTKKYQLSSKILSLGFGYLSNLDLISSTQEALSALSKELGVSAHLVHRDGLEVVYLARYAGNQHIVSNVHIGTRFPVHATALGQVLLIDLCDEEIAEIFAQVEMASYTKHTPTNVKGLIKRVSLGRKQGYLESWGHFEKGLASVAAPIRDNNKAVVGAMNITCPISRFSRSTLSGEIVQRVVATAKAMSSSLGYRE